MGGASFTSVPVRPGPNELQFLLAFDLGKRRVDWSGEARVVELDREIVATLLGGLLPGGAQLNFMWSST